MIPFLLERFHWAFALAALVSGGLLVWPSGARRGGLSTAEAVRRINREKGVLIDVSDPAEFAAGHAAGARNIPLADLEGAKKLPTNKTLPVILMCPTGARAGKAAAVLAKMGYENAQPVAGGTAAWREAGLPIEKS